MDELHKWKSELGDENISHPRIRVDHANYFSDEKKRILGVRVPQRLVDAEGLALLYCFPVHENAIVLNTGNKQRKHQPRTDGVSSLIFILMSPFFASLESPLFSSNHLQYSSGH